MKRALLSVTYIVLVASAAFAQRELGVRPTDTGGPLIFEQAVYDVQFYDVRLKVDPAKKWITGTSTMNAKVVIPTNVVVLDLDTPYTVSRVYFNPTIYDKKDLKFERRGNKIWVWFPMTKQVGENILSLIHI